MGSLLSIAGVGLGIGLLGKDTCDPITKEVCALNGFPLELILRLWFFIEIY
jgi:hypothetical protein